MRLRGQAGIGVGRVPSFFSLLGLVLPVFALIGVGAALRRCGWIAGAAEASLIRIVVDLCMPCLTFESVLGNSAVSPGNVGAALALGFACTAGGILVAQAAGRAMGLTRGAGLRTFAVTAGINNYAYLPLPIIAALWGSRATGLLQVHNVGVNAAVWSVALLVVGESGPSSGGGGLRRLLNPNLAALAAALLLDATGLAGRVPGVGLAMVHGLSVCAVMRCKLTTIRKLQAKMNII